jgi:hypothetical protein
VAATDAEAAPLNGFRRNSLGLRSTAITVAITALLIAAALFLVADGSLGERAARYGPAAVIAMVAIIGWWRLVRPGWVRNAAEIYADRLFEATPTLSRE